MNEYLDLPSPGFSKFREMIDTWDRYCVIQEQRDRISDMMDRHGMILFFKRGDDLFGAPEESRLVFAKLKSKDEDDPMMPGFQDEAKFTGINLFKSMFGSPEDSVENLFGNKDIPDIQVCDKEAAIDNIMNFKPKTEKKKKEKK